MTDLPMPSVTDQPVELNSQPKSGRAAKLRTIAAEELGLKKALTGWPLIRLLLGLLPDRAFGRTRTRILRAWGVKIGHGTVIAGTPDFAGDADPRRQLTIGEGSIINSPVHFDLNGEVIIGNRVSIGHHVIIVTTDHAVGTTLRRADRSRLKPVRIGDGAWVGARATLLPGVTIGAGAIVAAGAVVSSDIPANMVAVGNPARAAKALPPDEEILATLASEQAA